MQSVVRAASLGQLSRVTSTAVPNLAAPVSAEAAVAQVAGPGIKMEPAAVPLTSYSMSKQLLTGNQIRLTSGLGGRLMFPINFPTLKSHELQSTHTNSDIICSEQSGAMPARWQHGCS